MSNVHIYVMGHKLLDQNQQAQKIPDMLSYINKHLLSSIIRSTLTAIICLHYRVAAKMAQEIVWGRPCAGFDYDGW